MINTDKVYDNLLFNWLNTRNSELMAECDNQINHLINATKPELLNSISTEVFNVTFNNKLEIDVFTKYLNSKGLKLNYENINDSFIEYSIKISL